MIVVGNHCTPERLPVFSVDSEELDVETLSLQMSNSPPIFTCVELGSQLGDRMRNWLETARITITSSAS